MRVVVTGASGNVGTAVVRKLSEHPDVSSVVGVCRRRHDWRPPRTTWEFLDVAGDDLRPVFEGADAVIHLAWLFHPSRHHEVTWEANVLGTRAVLAAAADRVPVVVVASSVGAYSPAESDDPVDESWPTLGWPNATYSREKAFVERMLDHHEAIHTGMRVVRMRTAFVFQPWSAVQQRRLFIGPFVPLAAMRRGRLPVVPLPPGIHVQAVHADDVADAYVAAATRPVAGAFNIAAEGVLGRRELGELLHARTVEVPPWLLRGALASAFHLHLTPTEPGMLELALRLPVMSSARAREVLGWAPARDAGQAIAALLAGLDGQGGPTPPLARATGGPFRLRELATGIGERP